MRGKEAHGMRQEDIGKGGWKGKKKAEYKGNEAIDISALTRINPTFPFLENKVLDTLRKP